MGRGARDNRGAERARAASRGRFARAATALKGRPGELLVLIGVALGGVGTALAMLPGGLSPFGPAKVLVLLAAVALIAVGLGMAPARAVVAARAAIHQRGVWAALGLLGIAGISTLASVDPSQSLLGHYPEYRGYALLLASAFIGFGAYALTTDRDSGAWRALGRFAVVALAIIASYAALQFARLDPVPYERLMNVRRVFSTSGNASNLGVVLLMLLPLAVVRARVERGPWRVAAWAAFAAGMLALAWSLSRGAWAGAVVAALAWAAVELRVRGVGNRLARLAAIAAVAGFALVLIFALVPNAAGRMSAALDPSAGTIGWRTEVWVASAQMVAERPLLGFGPASFRYAFPPRRTLSMIGGDSANQVADDPHNLLASTAVASGALALGLLVWLLAEVFLASARAEDPPTDDASSRPGGIATGPAAWSLTAPALTASLAGAVVALQFHFATLDAAPMFAMLVGLALGRGSMRSAGERPSVADSAGPLALARVVAIAIATAAIIGTLLAAALVVADVRLARGFADAGTRAPWATAQKAFNAARAAAPWEPAVPWALGRAATQRVAAGDASAAADAVAGVDEARRRLPVDTLLVAQAAEAYLVVGQATSDRAAVERARDLAERAVSEDPYNGYRWTLKGSALAALGDTEGAVQALERAVQLTPGNASAWNALAGVYTRMGATAKADAARAKAAAVGAGM